MTTAMTDLNTFLATDVMKKKVIGDIIHFTLPSGEPATIGLHTFTPDTDIAQAMMCLDTFPYWLIQKQDNGSFCVEVKHTLHDSELPAISRDKSLPMAISLACAKARGFNNDS